MSKVNFGIQAIAVVALIIGTVTFEISGMGDRFKDNHIPLKPLEAEGDLIEKRKRICDALLHGPNKFLEQECERLGGPIPNHLRGEKFKEKRKRICRAAPFDKWSAKQCRGMGGKIPKRCEVLGTCRLQDA